VSGRVWRRRVRWLAALVGLCALATVPIGVRACRATRRGAEASTVLGLLVDRARALAAAGQPWPTSAVGPTPPVGACCAQADGVCAVDLAAWGDPTWKALAMTLDDPHRYSYAYEPTPTGARLRAIGDLDCDKVLATFTAELTRVGDTVTVRFRREHPDE
jgi:hypothetical protein